MSSASSTSVVRVDVVTYGLIRSDAALAYTLPTLESVVLFPLLRHPQFSTRLHVHVFCLKPSCDHRSTRERFAQLNATTLSIVHRRRPPPDKHADARQLNYYSAMDSLWSALQRALHDDGAKPTANAAKADTKRADAPKRLHLPARA